MIKINSVGLGSAKITSEHKTIYIDAFVADKHPLQPFVVGKADLILVTHDHEDHFCARKVAHVAKETGAIVVGPPTIAYPLLADEKLPPEQLQVYYPEYWKNPIALKIRDIPLKMYQSSHFGGWEPIHVSYLIELEGKRLYHTADSLIMDDDDAELHQLDVLMCNLVSMDPEKIDHVSVLEPLLNTFQPRILLPLHLLQCEWTLSIDDVKAEIAKRGLQNVIVLEHEQHVFEVA
jgi:L-ascorbate metabolism protein UlaG (beta-lactamase superfamily)